MKKNHFTLFASCIPVKGSMRSALCDIQRGVIKFIPNLLYTILTKCPLKSVDEIKSIYNNEYNDGIDAYFSLLAKDEWGFYTNEPTNFPNIELIWNSPITITNSIFDYSSNWEDGYRHAAIQLNELGCSALQLRIYDTINHNQLEDLLEPFITSRIKSIELLIKYDNYLDKEYLITLCVKHHRLRSVIIHSSPTNQSVPDLEYLLLSINYRKEPINLQAHCGLINESFFTANIEMFSEAQDYNSCLNRKISIDTNGEIKNCPSMQESYGNIKDTTLEQALNKKGFKKYWKLTKDKINICKDCEFRYICTDCRAYVEDPNDIYSKPLKCGYDPYTAKWEEWSTHPLKQKAIEYYGMEELIKTKY